MSFMLFLFRSCVSSSLFHFSLLLPHQSVIIRLLENIGSKKEVDQYLKYYSSIDTPRFAVIKVGGGCLMGAELETLANSLSFLADVGLIPVVLHGAGPQLNDELRSQGIESDYHGGMRVTTGSILKVARQVFLRENGKLTRALEERGTRSRPIVSGVFEAEYLDKEKMKFVGQVTKVNVDQVYQALEMGQVTFIHILTLHHLHRHLTHHFHYLHFFFFSSYTHSQTTHTHHQHYSHIFISHSPYFILRLVGLVLTGSNSHMYG